MLMFLTLSIIVIVLIYVSMLMTQDKDEASNSKRGNLQKKKKYRLPLTTYIKWYKRFHNNPLFRKEFAKIELRINELDVYTPQECRIVSTQFYMISLLCSLVVLIIGAIAYRDLIVTLLIVLYSQIVKNTIIFNQLDKVQYQVLKDLKMAISNVRDQYQTAGTVAGAINNAEVSSLLRTSFDDIYDILTAEDGADKLETLYATNPYKLVQTFTGICYIINDKGDTIIDNKGGGNFLNSLFKINEEINMEILRVDKARSMFKFLPLLPVIPVFCLSYLQSMLSSSVPGISYIYNGIIGYVSRLVIILSSIICYSLISKMTAVTPVAKDDRWEISKYMLTKKWFARFVNNIKPLEGKRLLAKRKELKKAISTKTMDHLYADKVILTVVLFTFSFVVSIIGIVSSRSYIYNSYTYKSFTADEVIDAKEKAIRVALDEKYLANKTKPSEAETLQLLSVTYPRLSTYELQDQEKRIMSKYDSYHNTYYWWWLLAIANILGYLGWLIPDFLLHKRMKDIKNESIEDVMQLQTMVSIIMYTTADTLDTLYWLWKQSRVHKDALAVCCQNYTSDALKAIDTMKRSDPENSVFIRMCNKLKLTAYQISLRESFADVEADREYILKSRELSLTEALNKKHFKATLMALVPIILMTILSLVVPLGIAGMSQFSDAMDVSKTIQQSD